MTDYIIINHSGEIETVQPCFTGNDTFTQAVKQAKTDETRREYEQIRINY